MALANGVYNGRRGLLTYLLVQMGLYLLSSSEILVNLDLQSLLEGWILLVLPNQHEMLDRQFVDIQ